MRSPLPPVGLTFLWLGVVSFGGGLAVIPEMHRELVDARGWLSPQEFAEGYAIGQLVPGPNMLSVAFYGYKIAGVAGGLIALAAVVLPGAALAALCGRAWATLGSNPWLGRLRRGLLPVGFGLMAAGVLLVARTTLAHWLQAALALAVAVVVYKKWVNPALAVLLAGALGALASRWG
ncbi:MAG TPA: chromate transporter [Polyangiaceae bacterium]|nr:chromate transporter [Polyangiaceae bacterium]